MRTDGIWLAERSTLLCACAAPMQKISRARPKRAHFIFIGNPLGKLLLVEYTGKAAKKSQQAALAAVSELWTRAGTSLAAGAQAAANCGGSRHALPTDYLPA